MALEPSHRYAFALGCALGALTLLGCSGLPDAPVGQLHLALSSGVGETHYRLARAHFSIEGTAQLELTTDDDSTDDSLQRALPVGDYSVELEPGWQLERVAAAAGSASGAPTAKGEASSGTATTAQAQGSQVVAADLVSQNPLDFSIRGGETTSLTFQFKTKTAPAPSDSEGQLRVDIEVDGVGAPGVVISELMKNPEVLPDADGEWIELHNAGSSAMNLGGCSLARDDQQLALDGAAPIPPGGYLTLSNGSAPGFTPDVLYTGVTLPNSGSFVLRLSCGGQLLDQVVVDPTATPNRAGHSLSLSGNALDSTANDRAENWCEGVGSYNGDFGTPGAANPNCSS
ncbi:MAG TPA: lamin tail domain-containing protein [Polyangiaceae bacterium]|nr:lamin tail domain-containing protein [Polyangiaceae bacterium]